MENSTKIKIAVIFVVSAIVITGSVIIGKRIKENNLIKKQNALLEQGAATTATTTQTGTSKPEDSASGWDPQPLAKEISTNIEGLNLKVYPETAKKILGLSDAKLKKLYTYYNQKYAKSYPTLTQLFQNEWSDWDGLYAKVVNRLVKLGLN